VIKLYIESDQRTLPLQSLELSIKQREFWTLNKSPILFNKSLSYITFALLVMMKVSVQKLSCNDEITTFMPSTTCLYGSQWGARSACLQTFFQISSFVRSRTKKCIQVCNNLRVSKWWQNFHFWANYPFNSWIDIIQFMEPMKGHCEGKKYEVGLEGKIICQCFCMSISMFLRSLAKVLCSLRVNAKFSGKRKTFARRRESTEIYIF